MADPTEPRPTLKNVTLRRDGVRRFNLRVIFYPPEDMYIWMKIRTGWSDKRILDELRTFYKHHDPDWYTIALERDDNGTPDHTTSIHTDHVDEWTVEQYGDDLYQGDL